MFLGAWLLASGGCTCIIDADKYRGGGGGGGDAGDIDAADNLPDAAVPDGSIESDAGPIEPTSAREGEGSGTGAPPVMIVLRGTYEAGTTARVVRSDDVGETDLVTEPAVVSGDGSMLAVGIRIPVDQNLDEADLSGSVDTTTLRPLYSSITISGSVALAGASPAILRSTSDITVGANLNASGATSGNQQGGAAVAGGCRGGNTGQMGQCSGSGGGAGGVEVTTGTGGGGAGHVGAGGGGANGGDGGEPSGSDWLVPLLEEGGSGGGGGGSGTIGAGGPGGGGGGIVELVAAGTLTIDGNVTCNGGVGTDGEGALAATAGGSGGGGSGGAVLVRAIAIAGAGSLSAVGGAGGDTFNTGGLGADGRIRIDVGTTALPATDADPAAVRGPHWADNTPHLVRAADLMAVLRGQPNTMFAANVDGGEPVVVMTNGTGRGEYPVTLEPGHNRICAIVSPTANLSLPEAVRCMIVTYVPE
jgi:hypothetical protein